MKILVDTHTHTNCSSHAHSTMLENVAAAKERGLEALCMTNHTPSLPDAPHLWHFRTIPRLPKEIDGLRMFYGAEANIIDRKGNIDLPTENLKELDIVIASIHGPCYITGNAEQHTATYLGALKNPYITVIGHSGSPKYAYDIDVVIRAAKEYNKCIEINNHSYSARPENSEICRKIALACKKYGTKILVSSDAHGAHEVGVFDTALEMLRSIDFPEELVMNTTVDKFVKYLEELKK